MGVFFETRVTGGQVTSDIKVGRLVFTVVLLVIFALLALGAERASMPTATANLWTGFQTILGIIVGFLGGEATGVASTK